MSNCGSSALWGGGGGLLALLVSLGVGVELLRPAKAAFGNCCCGSPDMFGTSSVVLPDIVLVSNSMPFVHDARVVYTLGMLL